MSTFNKATMVWTVTDTGALIDDAPGLTNPVVGKVVLIPTTASDSITFQVSGDTEDAIYLQSDTSGTTPTEIDFGYRGKRVPGLTCSAGSTGSKAYVYLL